MRTWLKENWKAILSWGTVLLICVSFLAIVIGGVRGSLRIERTCLDAGYTRVERIQGQLHCVTIRDGNEAIEPLDDVRERMKER